MNCKVHKFINMASQTLSMKTLGKNESKFDDNKQFDDISDGVNEKSKLVPGSSSKR